MPKKPTAGTPSTVKRPYKPIPQPKIQNTTLDAKYKILSIIHDGFEDSSPFVVHEAFNTETE